MGEAALRKRSFEEIEREDLSRVDRERLPDRQDLTRRPHPGGVSHATNVRHTLSWHLPAPLTMQEWQTVITQLLRYLPQGAKIEDFGAVSR